MSKEFGIGTRAVQSGYYPKSGGPRVVPIVQSTSYRYNTFDEVGDVAPYLINPFEYGANIVVHSTTKYSDGHAVALGGIIIDGGNFNWANGKFTDYTTPTGPSDLVFVDEFKERAFSGKLRVNLVEEFGAAQAPLNAFLTILGLETLHLRMERHCANALNLAEYLLKHPKVEWVRYPYLKADKEYGRAKKYLKGGASGILTFGVKGGIKAAKKVGESLKVASIVVNLGDVRTYVIHPASTTHIALTEEQQRAAGVTPELIRVSVGIEDIEDIIADFEQALDKI